MKSERISVDDCIKIYEKTPFFNIMKAADAVKKAVFKEHAGTVTFIADRNITYTNICDCKCRFCAFYRTKKSADWFTLTHEQILEKADGLAKIGGTQIMLQGGLNPDLGIDYYVKMLKLLKEKHPQITLHSLSPPEIDHLARKTGKSVRCVLGTLRDAGLDSLPGGGGEILINKIRSRISPNKITSQRWLQIMRTAHEIGMKSTITMMFGVGETLRERFTSMEKVRNLQDETGGFRAFIPWPFSPSRTELSNYRQADGVDYLKTLAISRIFFDNIKNIASGWVTEGMKTAQLGLNCGANDLGGILMEEKVVRATGIIHESNVTEFYKLAKGAGLRLARRNTNYDILEYIDKI